MKLDFIKAKDGDLWLELDGERVGNIAVVTTDKSAYGAKFGDYVLFGTDGRRLTHMSPQKYLELIKEAKK